MNIGSNGNYPASALSNFAAHGFEIDGVKCNSMEGFLQSLKFKNEEIQAEVCKLVGYSAKKKGRNKKWYKEQVLYWKGVSYKRDSKEYQDLLDKAYDCLFTNTSFKKALSATGNATLRHSMGKDNEKETVLTEREFCRRLTILREKLKED